MNDILSLKGIAGPAQFYFLCNATHGCHAEQDSPQFDTRHHTRDRGQPATEAMAVNGSIGAEKLELARTKRKAISNSLPHLPQSKPTRVGRTRKSFLFTLK